MSYNHLTIFERARIETLYEQGKPIRAIAEKLQRSPSTIFKRAKTVIHKKNPINLKMLKRNITNVG